MAEKKDVDDLAKLLDETIGEFERRKVTDDELDEIMTEHDRTAIQKSAQEFDVMLGKLSEVNLKSKGTNKSKFPATSI